MHSVCPYCGNSNEIGAKECNLCYYDLTASAREQPMATPSTAESDIMTTLLDDHATVDESEDYAVEAILSLDDVTVEIDQFETQGAGEDDEFAFNYNPVNSHESSLSYSKNINGFDFSINHDHIFDNSLEHDTNVEVSSKF